MDTEERALCTAIAAHPDEDTPRLVYADWLQEHDQPERAEFIRVQVELATYGDLQPFATCRASVNAGMFMLKPTMAEVEAICQTQSRIDHLRNRERELFQHKRNLHSGAANSDVFFGRRDCFPLYNEVLIDPKGRWNHGCNVVACEGSHYFLVRRGMIEKVHIYWNHWCRHDAKAILERHPVRTVEFSALPCFFFQDETGNWVDTYESWATGGPEFRRAAGARWGKHIEFIAPFDTHDPQEEFVRCGEGFLPVTGWVAEQTPSSHRLLENIFERPESNVYAEYGLNETRLTLEYHQEEALVVVPPLPGLEFGPIVATFRGSSVRVERAIVSRVERPEVIYRGCRVIMVICVEAIATGIVSRIIPQTGNTSFSAVDPAEPYHRAVLDLIATHYNVPLDVLQVHQPVALGAPQAAVPCMCNQDSDNPGDMTIRIVTIYRRGWRVRGVATVNAYDGTCPTCHRPHVAFPV